MNNKIQSDSSNSGFMAPAPLDQHPFFTQIKEVQSEGFNQLYTAERFGKMWLLKGLKAEYRQQKLYVVLLKKELDILMSLSYPYIVQAFGIEQVPDLGPCIVMEYVDGQTLKDLLQKGMAWGQKIKVLEQLLDALRYVHEKQIVHRDLKPSNILITHNGGNVKLIDFGLADTDAYRILKQPAGTLNYISPEQKEGESPDVRNDIYSVGCVLQDLQLGRSYEKVIRKCLSPIEQRYSDVAQLSEALHQVRRFWHRIFSLSAVVAFVLLLGYLTWQITEIRSRIPSTSTSITVDTDNKKHNHSEADLAIDQPYKDGISSDVSPMRGQSLDKDLDKIIESGYQNIDTYIRSTYMPLHMDTLTSIYYMDYKYYSAVALHVSQLIENYVEEVKQKEGYTEARKVRDALENYLASHYLNKWNSVTERLVREQQTEFNQHNIQK